MTKTISANELLNRINTITANSAMVIEFYDVFGWKTNRIIYRDGDDEFTIVFICPNGKELNKKCTKQQLVNYMVANRVYYTMMTAR